MSSFSTHNQKQRQNSRVATAATSHGLVASATLLGDDAPLPSKWVPKQQPQQQPQQPPRSPQSGSIAPPPSTIRVGANGTPQPLVVMPHGTPQQQPHPYYPSVPQYHHHHYPAAPAQQAQQQLPAAPQQVAMTEEASGLPVTSDVAVGMLRELAHDALLQLAEKMMRNFGDNSDPVRRTIRYCHEVKSTAKGVEEQQQQQSHLPHQPQQEQQQKGGFFTPVLSPQNGSGGSLSSSHSASSSNFGDTTNSTTPPLKHAEGEELFDLEKLMQQARRMYPTEFE